jgi:hypothetical protein
MNRRELTPYHSELAGILKSEPDRSQWKEFLKHERTTQQYKSAKEQAALRNSIKPILPEVVGGLPIDDKTEQLVNVLVTTIWAKEALNQYNDLPKANSAQRRKARNLVTQIAKRLLESPQDISIAQKTWSTTQESEKPFSELVRKECQAFIKDEWDDVMPGQLAQFVRISVNGNCPSQDDAKEMLKFLSNKSHLIITGFTIISSDLKRPVTKSQVSKVYFRKISQSEIDSYVKTKEPYDKAGAYAIQGIAKKFIEKVEGDFSNAVGLPIKSVLRELKKMGVKVL